MQQIFRTVTLAATFFLVGCEWFGPAERYKSEGGRTTYRSAGEAPTEGATPAPQKIPGESR